MTHKTVIETKLIFETEISLIAYIWIVQIKISNYPEKGKPFG